MRRRPYVGGELHEFDRVSAKSAQHELSHTQSGCEVPCPPLLFAGNSVFVRASGHQPLVLLFAAPPPAERSAPGPARPRRGCPAEHVPCRCRGPCRSAGASRDAAGCRRQLTRNSGDVRVASRNQLVTRLGTWHGSALRNGTVRHGGLGCPDNDLAGGYGRRCTRLFLLTGTP